MDLGSSHGRASSALGVRAIRHYIRRLSSGVNSRRRNKIGERHEVAGWPVQRRPLLFYSQSQGTRAVQHSFLFGPRLGTCTAPRNSDSPSGHSPRNLRFLQKPFRLLTGQELPALAVRARANCVAHARSPDASRRARKRHARGPSNDFGLPASPSARRSPS